MPTLQFKGKSFVQSHHLTVPFHELIPVPERSLTDRVCLEDNLIIHGDNLAALKSLLPQYRERVDVVYIDPPYNTGTESWVYNDNVNAPMLKAWLGRVVDRDDLSRHDKWLCMMMPRLRLLRELLAPGGVIFVSIDHNEIHHLRCLMDEVFGEENYRDTIVVRRGAKNVQAQFDTIGALSNGYESILVYSRNPDVRFQKVHADEEDPRPGGWNRHWRGTDRPTMRYPLFGITPERGQWRWAEARSLQAIRNYERMLSDLGEQGLPVTQENIDRWYLEEVQRTGQPVDLLRLSATGMPEHYIPPGRRPLLSNLWTDLRPTGHHQAAQILGGRVFDNPKPVALIQRLIRFATARPDVIVLDAFAGSGTTAHAVLDLNRADGGCRRFILMEMEAYADTITAERVRRVIRGVPEAHDETLRRGTGGSFSFYRVGAPLDPEGLLSGRTLPAYEELARYVFHTATGEPFRPEAMDRRRGFIGAGRDAEVYLVYEPDLEILKSLSITPEYLRMLGPPGWRRRVVFAPARWVDDALLEAAGVEFAQLPYALFQVRGDGG
ncbi:site-specific DNA-methyltransferase [Alicyclobacillus sp.]|uniref:site-specific DNA-methyltransferase n=1 Tax=Alicyclobacillus sp. TaxID=61169 RepID=UPI0025C43D1F|nr:site-specific DNA-methyltransferase [Alicyclobacillus sp.]MCL6515478.1 site-specific DNA-methyltransferase [Alicyclobacillus sp.]